ncbi:MAG: ATP-dependent metallopeptidase FtsH/Yme1/Tma family protein, partial [Solirubrobacteraceae bacterium]
MEQRNRNRAVTLFGALFLLFLAAEFWLPFLLMRGPQPIAYSRFLDLVQAGKVERVAISAQEVDGDYRGRRGTVAFVATRPAGVDDQALIHELQARHVEFSGIQPSGFGSFLRSLFLNWIVPLLLLAALWGALARRFGPGTGPMSFGRSQPKIYDRKDLRTSFADVAGVDEAVEELREVVDFLKHPRRYQRLGGKIPK